MNGDLDIWARQRAQAVTAWEAVNHVIDCGACHASWPCEEMEELLRNAKAAHDALEQAESALTAEIFFEYHQLGSLVGEWVEAAFRRYATADKGPGGVTEEIEDREAVAKMHVTQQVLHLVEKRLHVAQELARQIKAGVRNAPKFPPPLPAKAPIVHLGGEPPSKPTRGKKGTRAK